jgi:hypothetical protein
VLRDMQRDAERSPRSDQGLPVVVLAVSVSSKVSGVNPEANIAAAIDRLVPATPSTAATKFRPGT